VVASSTPVCGAAVSELEIVTDPRLPPLAWLLRWDASAATLLAGRWVETTDSSWVEGCWDGEFASRSPEGHWLAGTAGRLEAGHLTLTPPFHSFDAVYLLRRERSLFASNSLPFLIEASRATFRRTHVNLHADLARIVDGLDGTHLRIPMSDGDALEVLQLVPVTVALARPGEVSGMLPDAPECEDFASYDAFLRGCAQRFAVNATSPLRTAILRPVTTVSSGYDSPAVAVLARDVGATTALTIASSRGSRDLDGESDSGAEVADAIGLETVTFARDTRWHVDGQPVVAEFLASGMSGEELPIRVMAAHLGGTVLYSGYYGDSAWSREPGRARRLQRGDLGGSSLTEFRLRVGFCHLPMPFLAATRQENLARISCSEEMRPWSVEGRYDRPIPRRIAESAGVPRSVFGMRKRAVTSVAGRRTIVDREVAEAVRSFDRSRHGPVVRYSTAAVAWLIALLQPVRMKGHAVLRRIGAAHPSRTRVSITQRRAATLHGPHAVPTLLWAVELIGSSRYRATVEDGGRPRGDGLR
jgi:hypothetical protein